MNQIQSSKRPTNSASRTIKFLKYDPGFDLFDLRAALLLRKTGAQLDSQGSRKLRA
jgi:hypothetical protein